MDSSRRYDDLSDDELRDVDAACEMFEQSLRSLAPFSIESRLEAIPEAIRTAVFRELLAIELEWRFAHDQKHEFEEYHARFFSRQEEVRQVFGETGLLARSPLGEEVFSDGDIAASGVCHDGEQPRTIGRYRLEKLVGRGSFGLVYRAHDLQLDRHVAIKVPHATLATRREDLAAYLAEAQTVARLDHPNIVPVYDFGGDAHEMAESLIQFLDGEPGMLASASGAAPGGRTGPSGWDAPGSGTTSTDGSSPSVSSRDYPLTVVPRGLLSFDEHDVEFYLDLLPGPRDRTGLPDSVRFWRARIEERDAEKTFPVGLIFGPSGCCKSSLVKAGLLPRLSADVAAVYVEATAQDTETRIQSGIRKRFPEFANDLGLAQTLTALRRDETGATSKKLLIVLDQFEQWLHFNGQQHDPELVQALRQCDGSRVQCIVMVRDEFWLAVSRFMHQLEVDLVPGRNVALVDLFEPDHARAVLAAFGRGFGKLPENAKDTTRRQAEFLEQVLMDLADGGRVVPVRLSLFAEKMKGKPWTTNERGTTTGRPSSGR